MSSDKHDEIRKAARRHEAARMRFEYLGMMNTPSDPEERLSSAEEYAVAQHELTVAYSDLQRLIGATDEAQG